MAGKIYGTSTYRFDDRGALLLIREEKQDWDDNRKCFVRTIKERRGGRMVVVSTEIVK
jgi:CRISPR/Cas system CMR-associated protein Cmr3 (group 5 of RAMP superfamily)